MWLKPSYGAKTSPLAQGNQRPAKERTARCGPACDVPHTSVTPPNGRAQFRPEKGGPRSSRSVICSSTGAVRPTLLKFMAVQRPSFPFPTRLREQERASVDPSSPPSSSKFFTLCSGWCCRVMWMFCVCVLRTTPQPQQHHNTTLFVHTTEGDWEKGRPQHGRPARLLTTPPDVSAPGASGIGTSPWPPSQPQNHHRMSHHFAVQGQVEVPNVTSDSDENEAREEEHVDSGGPGSSQQPTILTEVRGKNWLSARR